MEVIGRVEPGAETENESGDRVEDVAGLTGCTSKIKRLA